MAQKKIIFTKTFVENFDELPKKIKDKTVKQLNMLFHNSEYPSLKIHKIKGTDNIWELRVDLRYRITFEKLSNGYLLRVIGKHDIIDKEKKK